MQVEVTAEMIAEAEEQRDQRQAAIDHERYPDTIISTTGICPVAKALMRLFGETTNACIGANGRPYYVRGRYAHADLPFEVKGPMMDFDAGREVQPFSFELPDA